MKHTHLRRICGVLLVGTGLLGSPAAAEQPASPVTAATATGSEVQEAFKATTKEGGFAEDFPEGKVSVVEQEVDGTAALLTTAHKEALEGERQREDYRQALVYQAAAKQALAQERYAVALYLTLHGRAIGHGVIRANTTRLPRTYQPVNLELIKRAGGVTAEDVERFVEPAKEEVPAVELLFTKK